MEYPHLRDIRDDRDITQVQVAKVLGITQPQYNLYEKGYRDIPPDLLIRLARFYKTSTDYLLGLTNDRRAIEDIIADHPKK